MKNSEGIVAKKLNETLFTKAFETQHNALSYVSCVKPSRYFFYIRPY
ncbi:hypothetical protein LEP1GSC124_2258 [Leptospira interrogans serovar Pyrogenes str. 200701872]|uniref:Uncharacterized protein n=1 Tax=Leptospira interrogans serovar Pyrogenes str. 200701872 TaxID=1193029 RepID=M6ZZ33_LEPIR|nr:hypothetical protein LEP1GSC124_2258 [Leptospira interrogans serovar Pyrogenes str. 200701872]